MTRPPRLLHRSRDRKLAVGRSTAMQLQLSVPLAVRRLK